MSSSTMCFKSVSSKEATWSWREWKWGMKHSGYGLCHSSYQEKNTGHIRNQWAQLSNTHKVDPMVEGMYVQYKCRLLYDQESPLDDQVYWHTHMLEKSCAHARILQNMHTNTCTCVHLCACMRTRVATRFDLQFRENRREMGTQECSTYLLDQISPGLHWVDVQTQLKILWIRHSTVMGTIFILFP